MIYLLIGGVILFILAAAATIYCRFVYSAMLDEIDVQYFDLQENGQS